MYSLHVSKLISGPTQNLGRHPLGGRFGSETEKVRVARGSEPGRGRGQGGMTTQITRRDETDRDRSERASHLSSNKLNGREKNRKSKIEFH